MQLKRILRCFTVVTVIGITYGCAVVVVKPENASTFHTAELCLYLHSPQEVAGWRVDKKENLAIKNELVMRGFSTRETCSAFSYGTAECAKKSNLTEAMAQICVKQYSEDFNAKRREIIERYARKQANFNEALSNQLDSLNKTTDTLRRKQEELSPFKRPY